MTPPPNAIPWRNSPCYAPPTPDSFSDDPSSLELQFFKRPMDPSFDPTFVDLVDALDAMMAPTPDRISTSKTKWNNYRAHAVSGFNIVKWLMDTNFAPSRSAASDFARQLVKFGGLIPTFKVESSTKTFNALPSTSYIHRGLTLLAEHGLNSAVAFPGKPRSAFAVLTDLNESFRQVCHVSVSLDGHFVGYESVRGSAGWRRTLILLSELAVCDDSAMHEVHPDVKKTCMFNLYNLLVFHAKLVFGHPTDLIKRSRFFNEAAYVIAGKRITSVELEHDICRRRMPNSDARSSWKLAEKDPRMHFILNCGAQSCPALMPLSPENIEEMLQHATERFIGENCVIDLPANKVTLSRLWKWFRFDFTPHGTHDADLLHWISERASKEMSLEIMDLMKLDYKVKFAPYNWADNGDINAKPDVRFMKVYDVSFAKTA